MGRPAGAGRTRGPSAAGRPDVCRGWPAAGRPATASQPAGWLAGRGCLEGASRQLVVETLIFNLVLVLFFIFNMFLIFFIVHRVNLLECFFNIFSIVYVSKFVNILKSF